MVDVQQLGVFPVAMVGVGEVGVVHWPRHLQIHRMCRR